MLMDLQIKISIIIPVYNVQDYLRQCLNSVVNQTLKEIEIIVINDCSTDKSREICDEYCKLDKRIILIDNDRKITQGLSRNKGIQLATGEYIGFVDADDYVDLDFFEKLYLSAKQFNTNIAKAEVSKILKKGKIHPQPRLTPKIQNGITKGIPLCLFFDYYHWSGIYKTEQIKAHHVKYADIRNAEDAIFLLQATYFLKTISIVKDVTYYYRQHENSTEAIRGEEYYNSILECFNLHIEFINKHEMPKHLYDKIFLKGFDFARTRYSELLEKTDLNNYINEYFDRLIELLFNYKYDQEDLLLGFYNGLKIQRFREAQKQSRYYKLAKVIAWFPGKLYYTFQLLKNHFLCSRFQ